ncbi:MAG: radical SAM protein [Clostridiales bacterium]|jgi:anaerobic ribonucleoside-triphosphate reductase activating protein|nr:radical SAM protein [Clostridiales bacterium]
MQIDRMYYPVKTLGYGERIGIWTIGCVRRCNKCSNPELWEEQPEKDISVEELVRTLNPCFLKCDGITITGGDPFVQADELLSLVEEIRATKFHGDILAYTGFQYEELVQYPQTKKILEKIDVLIDGAYIDSLNQNIGLSGSSNQRILVLNHKFEKRYQDADKWARKSQIVVSNGRIMAIGISPRTHSETP